MWEGWYGITKEARAQRMGTPVFNADVLAAEQGDERGLARVGVANDRAHRLACAQAPRALHRARAPHLRRIM
jgi:hypothetical protein